MFKDPRTAAEFRARARRYRQVATVLGSPTLADQLSQWADEDEAAADILERPTRFGAVA